jgi:hypothetical protein
MPDRFHTKRHVPFVALPRHKRRNVVVRLGWKIARQTDGQTFWTDHLLEDPEDPHHTHRWVDVYFLGADRFTLWNAEFVTTALAAEDEISERSFQAAYAQLSPEEIANEFAMEWETVPRKHPGAMRAKRMVFRPARHYPQFDGRTFAEECDRLEAHYMATSPPVIAERFVIDRSYAYGIGLHAVVAEDNLDRAAIERTIQRFRELGEKDWNASVA